jgi:hypothetical protein
MLRSHSICPLTNLEDEVEDVGELWLKMLLHPLALSSQSWV